MPEDADAANKWCGDREKEFKDENNYKGAYKLYEKFCDNFPLEKSLKQRANQAMSRIYKEAWQVYREDFKKRMEKAKWADDARDIWNEADGGLDFDDIKQDALKVIKSLPSE